MVKLISQSLQKFYADLPNFLPLQKNRVNFFILNLTQNRF